MKLLGKDVFRPELLIPSNNQLFGQVFLSRAANPAFRQTLNREKLQDNDAFSELKRFVRLGIDWMTVMYAKHTEEERAQDRESRRLESKSPRALLDLARQQIEALPEEVSPGMRKEALQAIELATAAIEEEHEERIGELQMLRVLASTGTMIVVFDHQLLGILRGLRESHELLGLLAKQLPQKARRQFEEILDALNGWIDDVDNQAKLLGLLLGRKARQRKQRLAVRPVVERIKSAFGKYTEDAGITLKNEVPHPLRTPPMFECELSAILINLITNSLKAVKFETNREIAVTGAHDGPSVTIRVTDTGVGADPTKWEEFFKPFVSESVPDPMLGTGTGLGLKIVKDFVDVYGGEARFVSPPAPWRTCLEITIPEP